MSVTTELLEYLCIECGKTISCPPYEEPDELLDWYDAGDDGCICFECRPKHLPELTERQGAVLGAAVLDLLKEIEDHTLSALVANGCPQHAEDLKKAAAPLWNAMDPLLGDGPRMVLAVAERLD